MPGNNHADSEAEFDLQALLEVFGTEDRRLILLALWEAGESLPLADLETRAPEAADRRDALTESHLPRLEDAGYIAWNRETDVITKGPNFGDVESYIDSLAGRT